MELLGLEIQGVELNNMQVLESLLRWLHVFAGIAWIGLLYFFNWVNANFAPTLDAESKKKVVPELMPRALYFFRWGAMFTWVTGVLLLVLVYYHTKLVFEEPTEAGWRGNYKAMAGIAAIFLAFFAYDVLMKMLKDARVQFVLGLVLASAVVLGLKKFAGFSFRGYSIHLGAMFGTIMFLNVWMRIWPAQRKIITAVKNGEKPDPDVVALAGGRSKHNTYMSVPLVFVMLAQHGTWASSFDWTLPLVILVGWLGTFALYKHAATVKGF